MSSSVRIVDLVSNEIDKIYEPAGRMADAILHLLRENGGCLPQDLNNLGFSAEEVSRDWVLAKSLAEIEIKLLQS